MGSVFGPRAESVAVVREKKLMPEVSFCSARAALVLCVASIVAPVRAILTEPVGQGTITVRIGIQGRVIAGPARAPSAIQVPIRVAVVQGGVSEKTIATKAYQTTVNMGESGSEPFTMVAEDLVYPAPPAAIGDNYIFYIGFDPQSLKHERPAPAPKKKKQP